MAVLLTRVSLEGKGAITLKANDHIATGGQGSIYRIGGYAVKMYLDPEKMRREGLPEKIKLLAKLAHPYIVAPQGVVLDDAQQVVGHYLPFIDDGHAISLVFTTTFWTEENFDVARASELASGMRDVVEFAHQQSAVLVDANELNWFVMLAGKVEPRAIDVDSWAIGKWGPSAIMPSIRDWNSKSFDDSSDWFAWAIVTFQVYTGLHPYKGKLDGFKMGDLIGRMKARASVFSPGVQLNAAVRNFKMIPAPLLSWYEAVFQGSERARPPSPLEATAMAPAAKTSRMVTVSGAGLLSFQKILSTPGDPVARIFHCGVVLTRSGRLIDLSSKRELLQAAKGCEVVRFDRGWLIWRGGEFLVVDESSLDAEVAVLRVQARDAISYENRLFVVTERGLHEVQVRMFARATVTLSQNPWGIMVNSTKWFNGVGIMDAIGAMYVVAPFGADKVATVRVKELDGLRAVAGKAGNRFVSLIALDHNGNYLKLELTFDKNYSLEPKIWQGPSDSPELNLAILPQGVCATIVKDGELDIFVPTTGAVKRVEDHQIATDMRLSSWGSVVAFVQNGDVWTVKLR